MSERKKCCKMGRFPLNYHGSQRLHYDVIRQNVLEEIQRALDDGQNWPVANFPPVDLRSWPQEMQIPKFQNT